MNSNRLVFLFLLVLFIFPVYLPAETVRSGHLRMDVDKDSGIYNFYVNTGSSEIPLLTTSSPGSTNAAVIYGKMRQDILSLGGKKLKEGKISITGNSFEIIYTFATYRVAETAEIISAGYGDSATEYIRHSFSLTNRSDSEEHFWIRILLDTYLGEGSINYILPDGTVVNSETLYPPENLPGYIFSGKSDGTGFYIYLDPVRTSAPSKVILANWKRLNESPADFQAVPGRSFYAFPNPDQDSAAALYYDLGILQPGESKKIIMYYGYQPKLIIGEFAVPPVIKGEETDREKELKCHILLKNLSDVDGFLEEIDNILLNNIPISDEMLMGYGAILDQLKKDKEDYEKIR